MKVYLAAAIIIFFISGCERPTDSGGGNDGIPPGVPEGLRIYRASDGDIIIDWIYSKEPDISRYIIYRSMDSLNFVIYDSSYTDYYYDDSLDYSTRYFYKITAKDLSDNESSFSGIVSAVPANKLPPFKPQGIEINARFWEDKKIIYLSWNSNEESDFAGYKIYRGVTGNFPADTNSFIGATDKNEFEDSTAGDFYKNYYYKIKAFDKGGLVSDASAEVSDMILEKPVLVSPGDNSIVTGFRKFIFRSVGVPADYKIIVQTNIYFGEVWQTDVSSELIYDTLEINVPSGIFYYNTTYYWRVAAYSSGSGPNSISPLNKFIIKQ